MLSGQVWVLGSSFSIINKGIVPIDEIEVLHEVIKVLCFGDAGAFMILFFLLYTFRLFRESCVYSGNMFSCS